MANLIYIGERYPGATDLYMAAFVDEATGGGVHWDEVQRRMIAGETLTIRPPTPDEVATAEAALAVHKARASAGFQFSSGVH